MADDLRTRMSCPACRSPHVPFTADGRAICGECKEKLRYMPGRFVLDCSLYDGLELISFNHGYEAGYDAGRADGIAGIDNSKREG